MLLDQSMSQQAPQPVIECLPRPLRLIELHELVELIACGESGTEDLLQQRDVPHGAELDRAFSVPHGKFSIGRSPLFPTEGPPTSMASRWARRKTCPVPLAPMNTPASTASLPVRQIGR